ncbi:MAG: alpha/beta fold hydrolase [Jatrophihabitantaceae bacterium]
MRLCTEDDIFLTGDYYARVSDGPAYLLGHGFTGSAANPKFRAAAEHLHERGASVLALSFRGHGTSEGYSTVGVDEIRDVAAGLAWLHQRRPGVPVITLGFSMGASVMIRAAGLSMTAGPSSGAGQPPQPAAVIAVSGPGRWYERGTKPMQRLHFGVETALGRQVLRRVFKTRVGGGWDLLPVSPVEVAGAITVPVLIVHGADDPYFGLAHPRMLAAAIPSAQLWIEAGMGHAENATGPELLDRIDDWARQALGESATMGR